MWRRFLYYIGIVLIVFIIPVSLVEKIRDPVIRAISPIGRFFVDRSVRIHNAVASIEHINDIRTQNTQLQQQVLSLEQKNIDDDALTRENSVLKNELGVTGTTQTTPKVLAQILFYSGTDPLDRTFTVNVGSTSGIAVGQPAVYDGALIGRIITVRPHSSVIRSITSQKSIVQARISFDQEEGLIIGTGNSVKLEDITQGTAIPSQSIVETSGLGGDLPQGILIGNTDNLLSASSDSSQTFAIDQIIDPTTIPAMFILLTDTGS